MSDYDFYFAIPSYKRAEKQKTLKLLESLGVPKDQIVMSVQTQEDYAEYTRHGIKDRVFELIYSPADKVSGNMNTLLNYFQIGQKIVILEDDINDICKLVDKVGGGKGIEPIKTKQELYDLVKYGFSLCKKHKTCAFGLSMTRNPFFMTHGYKTYALSDTGF